MYQPIGFIGWFAWLVDRNACCSAKTSSPSNSQNTNRQRSTANRYMPAQTVARWLITCSTTTSNPTTNCQRIYNSTHVRPNIVSRSAVNYQPPTALCQHSHSPKHKHNSLQPSTTVYCIPTADGYISADRMWMDGLSID